MRNQREVERRALLKFASLAGAASLLPRSSFGAAAPTWSNASIRGVAAAMKAGSLTSRLLCEVYLKRIADLNPKLRAILEVNPDALAIADALDLERTEKGPRGPMHGVPVVVKDNLDTGDKMETTAGSLALLGSKAPRDAFVVAQLRKAGAVILAKSNLSEWANIRSTHSSSGWSARGGQGLNPYSLDRSPIGSSSGSGAAVAADLCVVAVGTETDGSITAPASAQALVGLKPTVGLLSRSGIIPVSSSQDTPGPMARTVEDAALLLNAMLGEDGDDEAMKAVPQRAAIDYSAGLGAASLKGARLGFAANLMGEVPGVKRLMERALTDLKRLGAEVITVEVPNAALNEPELEVLLTELKATLASYLSARRPGAPMKTLADVIAFNVKNASVEMPYFGQELFEQAEKKGPLTGKAYLEARAKCERLSRRTGIDAVMKTHRLNALIAPTIDPAWVIDSVLGDRSAAAATSPAAVSGYPSVSVPMGEVAGLPVGLLFFSQAWSEQTLLRLAYAYEQGTLYRKPPPAM